MRNRYEIEVRAQCPANSGDTDLYQFTIECNSMIKVEEIMAFVEKHAGQRNIFQEELTQKCAITFGAQVTSVGWHSGVRVTCLAP